MERIRSVGCIALSLFHLSLCLSLLFLEWGPPLQYSTVLTIPDGFPGGLGVAGLGDQGVQIGGSGGAE